MNKKQVFLTSLFALGTISVLSFGQLQPVYAQTSTSGSYPSLIQRIIDKFKLNKTEVDTLVTEQRSLREQQRTDRQAQRVQIVEDKLSQAVKDGKITEAQKANILKITSEHRTEMQASRENFIAERDEHRAEMDKLGDEYGVDIHELIGYGTGGMGKGYGRGMGDGYGMGRNR